MQPTSARRAGDDVEFGGEKPVESVVWNEVKISLLLLDLIGDSIPFIITAVACHCFSIHYAAPFSGIAAGIILANFALKGVKAYDLTMFNKWIIRFQNSERRLFPFFRLSLFLPALLFSNLIPRVSQAFGLAFGVTQGLACHRTQDDAADSFLLAQKV